MTSFRGLLRGTLLDAPDTGSLTSVLAADIGRARTKLALFSRGDDGRWRLRGSAEALGTAQSRREGVLGGVATAARELESSTGQTLTAADGSLLVGQHGRGVDALVASSSAANPLSLVILATTAERSGLWARVASQWSHVQVLDAAAMDAGLNAGFSGRWADALHVNGQADVAAKIRLLAPDAVLVAGGYDDGNVAPLLDIARLIGAARPAGSAALTVVYAGNAGAAAGVAKLLGGRADLRIVENLLPDPDTPQPAAAGEALDNLYCERKLGSLSGHNAIANVSAAPILSAGRALALAWSTLADMWKAPVLGFDIGASTTIAGSFLPEGAYELRVDPQLGVSNGWDGATRDIDATAIARWMPLPMSKTDVQTRLAARQGTIGLPQTEDAELFQEALTREAWRTLRPTAGGTLRLPAPSKVHTHIVGSGGVVAHTPSLWRVALMLLDSTEPSGVVHLWADRSGALAQVGALAGLNRYAAMSALPGSVLTSLGAAICLSGSATAGSKAVDVEMQMPDGSVRRTIAAWGSIHLIPTGGPGSITVTLRLAPGVYVPGYPEARTANFALDGGDLGIILDCRTRPLSQQLDPARGPARMHGWIAAGEA